MAGYSSRKNRLWYFALRLAEEETKFNEITQQTEEHGQIIQSKYNQLASNLTCLGDITAMMYEQEKLTLKELEDIQHLHSTPIRANEELLGIIARKPRDAYECFLSLIRKTNQLHLYQLLVFGDDTCDKTDREFASEHKDLICRNFMELAEKLNTETGLIYLLYQRNVLTVRERERFYSVKDTIQKNELLLGLLSKKSSKDFEIFLETLDESGQGHLRKILRKSEDSTTVPATCIANEPSSQILHESGQKPNDVLSLSSRQVAKPETLYTPKEKLIPLRSLLTKDPFKKSDTQTTSVPQDSNSTHAIAKDTEKEKLNHRRTGGARFQARKEGLEPHLKTEIAIKVTSVSFLYLDKPNLNTCFRILLQDCHRMRNETIARNVESQAELEQLRENASQYSASESLNEVFRTELHSMQQELTDERFQRNKDRLHLEEKINKLTADLHDEKAKCRRFHEEKLLSNTIVMNLEESLKKAESDKQRLQQQLLEQSSRLEAHESLTLRTNQQFLVENIKASRLIELLHEKKCITDEERYHLNNQPGNFFKNDALLHWMRTITHNEDKRQMVLECFRQSEQNFIADLFLKGGVLLKFKISTEPVKERQPLTRLFSKSVSENMKAFKKKEALLIEEINQRQGMQLASIQDPASEIAFDEIIIAPYCHQEENGIVFWFWCQSKNAQRTLHQMYSLDTLLEKIVTIFKQISIGGVSPASQLLVPNGIVTFVDDLTKNEKVIDFTASPKLLFTIRAKKSIKTYATIYALAVLADEIFAVTSYNSELEVYNRSSLQFQRSFTVDNLKEPRDIVSCFRNNCLYIIDGKPIGPPMEILMIDINGNILKRVWQGNDWGRLSVTEESTLILAVLDKSKLLEITPDGQLVREITLGVWDPWHAVKIAGDRFVVTYTLDSKGSICVVDSTGMVVTCMSHSDDVCDTAVYFPVNLAVNGDGSVLVVDEDGGRIILLTSKLEYQREILSKKHGLRLPRRIFVDEAYGRLLVCDNETAGGRILVFDAAG